MTLKAVSDTKSYGQEQMLKCLAEITKPLHCRSLRSLSSSIIISTGLYYTDIVIIDDYIDMAILKFRFHSACVLLNIVMLCNTSTTHSDNKHTYLLVNIRTSY